MVSQRPEARGLNTTQRSGQCLTRGHATGDGDWGEGGVVEQGTSGVVFLVFKEVMDMREIVKMKV